ncbi:hypothetical protein RFI_22725 [Reticulomyxa filosa]|uniref:Uncharacterized protein n=1 Tax=Reticulomyxa filosa TaxID=46433 RepID=X6MNG2_RETFI|nr:hypothetical protein RFI_22725 [Reticulomyxa filosa]|eukprot:ETO14645.1 hypothetical protein RFI_22725 [Reticulomyxa filosa]
MRALSVICAKLSLRENTKWIIGPMIACITTLYVVFAKRNSRAEKVGSNIKQVSFFYCNNHRHNGYERDCQKYSYVFEEFEKDKQWVLDYSLSSAVKTVWSCKKCSHRNFGVKNNVASLWPLNHDNIEHSWKGLPWNIPSNKITHFLPQYNICEKCSTPQFQRLFQIKYT